MPLIGPDRVGHRVLPPSVDLDGGLWMSLTPGGVQLFLFIGADTQVGTGTDAAPMAGPGAAAAVFAAGDLHFVWHGSVTVGLLRVVLRDRTGAEFMSASGSYRARVDRHDGLTPLSAARGFGQPLPASVALVDPASGRLLAVRGEPWPPGVADRFRDMCQALDGRGSDPGQDLHQLRKLAGSVTRRDWTDAVDTEGLTVTWSATTC